MLNKFGELIITEEFKIRRLLPLFIVSVLTFGIAHNNAESIAQVLRIKVNAKYNEADMDFNLRAYQLYNQYKKLCEDSVTTSIEILNDLFQTMREFFESATEKKMKKLLFLFEPFVLLSQHVEEEVRAVEMLTMLCNEYPALLPYTAKILSRCRLDKLIGRMSSEVSDKYHVSSLLFFALVHRTRSKFYFSSSISSDCSLHFSSIVCKRIFSI